ncbi:UDP-glycosyltransferase [Psychroflexus sp. MBR-150]|jgi:glycosyltransferase involved in cell wall biosynthesis
MNILVTNNQLDTIGGSETFIFTLTDELVRLGHKVDYFTFKKGYVSNKMENMLGVSFMNKNKYDIIFSNHNTTVEKIYKKGFTIQTCHGIFPRLEQPNPKANAYVSISQEVQDHLAMLGYPSVLIHNSINLKRFNIKSNINKELKSVLSLCHSDEANSFVESACKEMNIKFNQAYKYKDPIWDIEKEINKVDLVVGLGRSAYEAMACGRPVVIYDNRRYFPSYGDGYIKGFLGFSLKNNCSGRYFKNSYNKADFIKEVLKYNSGDSLYFREFAERELNVQKNILKYFEFADLVIKNKKIAKRNTKIKTIKKLIGNKNFKIIANIYNKF